MVYGRAVEAAEADRLVPQPAWADLVDSLGHVDRQR
jgi:hypothetical protein